MNAIIPCLLTAVLGTMLYGASDKTVDAIKPNGTTAYLGAAAYGDGFLAIGTEGRIDFIGGDGVRRGFDTATNHALLDVDVSEKTAIAVGERGTALRLDGIGGATALNMGTKQTLRGVCKFQQGWLVGGDDGTLLQSNDLTAWQAVPISLKGAVTGIAAGEKRCIGVTDRGETFTTTDGKQWTVLDYNAYYGQTLHFSGIEQVDDVFWSFGVDENGTARLLTSIEGGVWSERSLTLEEVNETTDLSDVALTAICGDGQQAVALRADGQALTLPSCSVCNKLTKVSEFPLYAAAHNAGKILFAGEGYQFVMQNAQDIRQEHIRAEAALQKQKDGAIIIDVRSRADYDKKHIAGSIHLAVDEVQTQLAALIPDRNAEIIFYCAAGTRSQKALETAQTLGYANVYNLGGIDDWPYATEGIDA